MIELYIENQKIDLTENFDVSFNYETIDPDKLSSIKNSFSKTVNIPGTPNNNKTFGYIFRYDKYFYAPSSPQKVYEFTSDDFVNGAVVYNRDLGEEGPLIGGGNSNYQYFVCPVKKNDTVFLQAFSRGGAAYTYGLANSDNIIYENSGQGADFSSGHSFVVHQDGYLYMNNDKRLCPPDNTIVTITTSQPSTMSTDKLDKTILTIGKYWSIGNNEYAPANMTSNKDWGCCRLEVKKGQLIYVFANAAAGGARTFALTDKNNLILKRTANTYNIMGIGGIVAPTEDGYLYVNNRVANIDGFKIKVMNYNVISDVINIGPNYDPHKKVNWFINRDGSLLQRGYCTLDNIIFKNDYEITYQMTLYGGLGEFFYSLSYNEDGSPKTLYDLYWDWIPVNRYLNYGDETTPTNENSVLLYKAEASVVAQAYHNLRCYNYDASGVTTIDQDIVFVPAYQGYYEDFDSKTMLVSTTIQQYDQISNDTRSRLQRAFPNSIEKDDKTYTTLNANLKNEGIEKYGLVKFSRDIDPWEAGEIRVKEMPVGIRLSKFLEVISNPLNNGGYEVVWDNNIKNSYYWKYGWIVLPPLKQEKNQLTSYNYPAFTGNNVNAIYNYDTQQVTSFNVPIVNIFSRKVDQGTYELKINYRPVLNFEAGDAIQQVSNINYIDSYVYNNNLNVAITRHIIYNTYVILNTYKLDNQTISTSVDIVMLNSSGIYNFPDAALESLKTVLQNYLTGIGEADNTISEYNLHNLKLNNITFSSSSPTQAEALFDNFKISPIIEVMRPGNLTIQQRTIICWTHESLMGTTIKNYESGIYVNDQKPTFSEEWMKAFISTPGTDPDLALTQQNSPWPFYDTSDSYNMTFNLYSDPENKLVQNKGALFKPTDLYKSSLFANSESPMKYFSGFSKLMNYRFICDNISKKIYIKELKNYYIDKTYNLDNKVDLSRDIKITPVTPKYKNINIGLETPETYPVTIFNKNSKDKFNTLKYVTNVEYPLPDTKLFNDLIYKNTIDWQQNSIFYNLHPQFPRAYNTTTISWNLFNKTDQDLETTETITIGVQATVDNLMNENDYLPKMAMFNKENKIEDISASLMFLNGFVKNYDYQKIEREDIVRKTIHSNEIIQNKIMREYGELEDANGYNVYVYNYDPTKTYYMKNKFLEDYDAYFPVAVYFDSNRTYIGKHYSVHGIYNEPYHTLERGILLPPQNTAYIYVLYKNDAAGVGLFESFNQAYYITPRTIFTNDTYEQYYLNQERCYQYDFNYTTKVFNSWGYRSTDDYGSASSWVLPFFTKDLYNTQLNDVEWNNRGDKVASWNIINQNSLDNVYNLSNTMFIKDPDFHYDKMFINENYTSNEYGISSIPTDSSSTRIYDNRWEDYMDDLYDRNSRDIVAYVDISQFGDPNLIMRYFYIWKGRYWIITKIENYRIGDIGKDKFTKVTLHKIKDKTTWTN